MRSTTCAQTADGTAPADAPLIIAVGERRIAGLRDKRDALRATIADADAALRAAARAATACAAPRLRPGARAAEDDDPDALPRQLPASPRGTAPARTDRDRDRDPPPKLARRNASD